MRKKLTQILLVALVAAVTEPCSSGIISNIARYNSNSTAPQIAGPLLEGSRPFVDRDYKYRMVPPDLIGAEYVMVANDDKNNPSHMINITLSQDATLYLFVDNRLGHGDIDSSHDGQGITPELGAAGMDWVFDLGFEDTMEDIAIYEESRTGILRWSSVFAADMSQGLVTLQQQADVTDSYDRMRNMYAVAAVPEPMTLMIMSVGGLIVLTKTRCS